MTKHNEDNERIKRKYFAFLGDAKRLSEQSVDGVASALNRFETYANHRDFKTFHFEQAVAFKKHLAGQKVQRTGKNLSKATLHGTLTQLKQFFQWLSREQGYKTRIQYSDAEYFNLPLNDTHIATAKREKKWPTLEQIKRALNAMLWVQKGDFPQPIHLSRNCAAWLADDFEEWIKSRIKATRKAEGV